MLLNIVKKVQNRGVSWAISRLKDELTTPRLPVTKKIYNPVFKIVNNWARDEDWIDDSTLNLVYDLRNAPATFNICDVLLSAELSLLKSNSRSIHVHFVCLRNYNSDLHDSKIVMARLHQVLIPVCMLHKRVSGYTVVSSANELLRIIGLPNTLPSYYHPKFNIQLPNGVNIFEFTEYKERLQGIRASNFGISYVERFLQHTGIEKQIVTLVLREQGYDPARNSNLAAWFSFAQYLKSEGFVTIIVPDSEAIFERERFVGTSVIFDQAAVNIDIRMALYERSYLVMGSNGGALSFASFNPIVPFIIFNFFPKGSINNTEENLSVFWGKKFKNIDRRWWSHPYSKISLLDESYESFKFEFECFKKRLIECS